MFVRANVRSRRLLDTTNTEDTVMAAPAISGLSSPAGCRCRKDRPLSACRGDDRGLQTLQRTGHPRRGYSTTVGPLSGSF